MSCLVERELFRAACFEQLSKNVSAILIRSQHVGAQRRIGDKEVSQLLLRYVFNKIPVRRSSSTDDPVFITTPSPAAVQQIERDLLHFGIDTTRLRARDLVEVIEHRFARASEQLKSTAFKCDDAMVRMQVSDGGSTTIVYKSKTYPDHCRLAQRLPVDLLPNVLALSVRYTYLQLANQGLACDYRDKWRLQPGDATEAFASSFNRYFDSYFSAFPDLEAPLGSRGSFFDIKADPTLSFVAQTGISTQLLVVNPPFDETVMKLAVRQVLLLLEHAEIQQHTLKVRVILPAWQQFEALETIQRSRYATGLIMHRKGTFPFRNHMNGLDSPNIFPCDVYECILQSI